MELRVVVPNGRALLALMLDEGGLFVAGADNVSAGSRVMMRVEVGKEAFKLRGKVLWRRTRGAGRLGMVRGAGVVFDETQKEAVRRLFSLAREPDLKVVRRESPRRPLSLQIRYNSRFGLDRDLVRDLSMGGLRIHTTKPPAVGHKVVIYLRPPRALLPLRLEGEVMWSEPEGVDPCFGVRFLKTSPRDRRRLQRLLDRLDRLA